MTEHRLRLNDVQLNFLVKTLSEILESYERLLIIYETRTQEAKREFNQQEYDKVSSAYHEIKRKIIATEDMIRCFNSVMKGGRPRPKVIAKITCIGFANEKKA